MSDALSHIANGTYFPHVPDPVAAARRMLEPSCDAPAWAQEVARPGAGRRRDLRGYGAAVGSWVRTQVGVKLPRFGAARIRPAGALINFDQWSLLGQTY